MRRELKVIQDFYDFMLWAVRHTEKFPRHHRYSLGTAMEKKLLDVLQLLLWAKYHKQEERYLPRANIELEVLRFQMRMAADLGVLPIKSQGHAAERMQAIGAQIGGWLASRTGGA